MTDVILAVDPGKKSGLAKFRSDLNEVYIGYEMSRFELLDHIYGTFEMWGGEPRNPNRILVVAEKYIITPKTSQLSQQPDALKINGVLEWICYKFLQVYEEQSQSTAKKIAQDKRLHDLGLYYAGRGHANDATRHLLFALERHLPSVFEREGILGYNPSVEIKRIP